jgi:hypothetical protein
MGNWQPIAHFLQVLQLLPNLRNLAIVQSPPDMIPVVMTSMRGKIFPSVMSLALPNGMESALHCFPNVRSLNGAFQPALLEMAKGCCTQLETIDNFLPSAQMVKCGLIQVGCIWALMPSRSPRDAPASETAINMEANLPGR